MGIPVLVVNNDPNARRRIRQALEVAGYTTVETEDAESGLATLQESESGMVVLFTVALFNNIMARTDGIAFLGAAACDTRLAHQHAFVIITPTPDELESALGRLLRHLAIPLIAEPLDSDDLLHVVAEAEQRLLISS